jgi:hypothetical protein
MSILVRMQGALHLISESLNNGSEYVIMISKFFFNFSILSWVCLGSDLIAATSCVVSLFFGISKIEKRVFFLFFLVIFYLLITGFLSNPITFKLSGIYGVLFAISAFRHKISNATVMGCAVFIFYIIFDQSNGLTGIIDKNAQPFIGHVGSINGLSIYLFFVSSLYYLRQRFIDIYFWVLLATATLLFVFVPSRQTIFPLALLLLMYVFSFRKNLNLFTLIIPAILITNSDLLGLIFDFKFSNGLETERGLIWDCFLQNFDVDILLLGGYGSESGSCASFLGDYYLHSLFLDGIVYYGMICLFLCFAIFYSMVFSVAHGDFKYAAWLLLVSTYGLIEMTGFWYLVYPTLLVLNEKRSFLKNHRSLNRIGIYL